MFGRFFYERFKENRFNPKTAGMRQQMMQHDLTRIGIIKGLDMAMNRVIKPQLTLLRQNRDGSRHNRLGIGCHAKHGVFLESDTPLLILPSQSFVHNHPALARNQDHRATHLITFNGFAVHVHPRFQNSSIHANL